MGAVVAGAVTAIGCCTPQLATWMITPRDPFDAAKVPAPPDYARDDAWLALPSTDDAADVALVELPVEKSPAVDVFYVHSTSSIAAAWNAGWDDAEVCVASIRGGTLIQGSVFNGCCAVYAPEYRQASGHAFTHPSSDGDRAMAVAFSDVSAAFDALLARTGGAWPFIIAGHGQGSVLLAQLLRDRIARGPE